MQTLIIAEAGVNHNGDINLAKELINAAAFAGADLVKFQTFKASRLTTETAGKAAYQIKSTSIEETQQAMLAKLELTEAMHHEILSHCKTQNIGFLSTGFDIESVNFLVGLGMQIIKIPSGEITNLPYLRHIGSLNKTLIVSTGMSSMSEIESAINVLEDSGTSRSKITVLHCTTSYPAPINEVNLLAMQSIKRDLHTAVGYSDHTLGIEIPIAAVALGASVIEKHFTLDRTLPGPDHKASLEPGELQVMIKAIRNIEQALGDGIKRIMPSEIDNRMIVRKSIVARRAILAGEVLSEENLATKRPGVGLSPMDWDKFLGMKARRNYLFDELIDEA
jgi:N,N'-diacetyllegionaminate synthase